MTIHDAIREIVLNNIKDELSDSLIKFPYIPCFFTSVVGGNPSDGYYILSDNLKVNGEEYFKIYDEIYREEMKRINSLL